MNRILTDSCSPTAGLLGAPSGLGASGSAFVTKNGKVGPWLRDIDFKSIVSHQWCSFIFSDCDDTSLNYYRSYLLTPGNDQGVTPHSTDQSDQFRSRAMRSIEHERVHDFHSKQFSCRQPFNYIHKRYIDMDDQICSISLLVLSRPTWKVFTDITYYLPHMKSWSWWTTWELEDYSRLKWMQNRAHLSCRRMHFFTTRRDSQLIMPPT